jgi:uncharacterized protein YbaP (TraB family)
LKKLILLALFCASSLLAQEKKYQSLLWEVSGNGLAKKSYLYGSMHVSDKVSYHLSDAFFTHLLGADIIANESEPSTWTSLFGVFNPDYNGYNKKFYSGFYQYPLTKDNLYPLFRTKNFTLDNLLFRTNENQKEYQEETYLDMFIYRTGKKYNKRTVGLEDTKTSIVSLVNADLTNTRPKDENRAAIQKLLKNTPYDEALMNFYRDKDLDMIDSLTSLSSSPNYLKALLYDRNIVMVKSIDSIMKQGSLFAAVGAAHLPGKKGIIELLRKKGYKVTPVYGAYTDKGKAKKQQIEEYFVKPVFKRRSTADGIIELPLFTSVIENKENLESPDLANGGYINVKRMLLLDYLKKDNRPFNHATLDSLFYENIPGKILDKKFYVQDGYSIYDIKNITKTGNAQRYRYYVTPIEIITVSMSGEGNYVRQFESDVFNNIVVKPLSSAWAKASPKQGGFEVYLPAYATLYGDKGNSGSSPSVDVHAYDGVEKANYFLLERTLQDNDNLEDTNFELKRMHYEFYNQFDIDSTQTKLGGTPVSFTSASKLGVKDIRLKSVIKGAKYYLLGSVGASEVNTDRFFNSFAFIPATYAEDFRTYTDSSSSIRLEIPKVPNEKLDFAPRKQVPYSESEKINVFQEKYNSYAFTLPSGQSIDMSYYQYHRYNPERPIDSLWTSFRKLIKGYDQDDDTAQQVTSADEYDYDDGFARKRGTTNSTWEIIMSRLARNRIQLINEKTSYNKDKDYYQIDMLAVEPHSSQAIKYKAVYKNRSIYVINTVVEKNYKGDDPFIERIFNSFIPLDAPDAAALPEDRIRLFIEDAQSEYDSIRFSAFASVNTLSVKKDNLIQLEDFIEKFAFRPDEADAQATLYDKIGNIKHPSVIPFMEKQYKQPNSNTTIQFAALKALASQKTKAGYKKIIDLLEYDLPVSDNPYDINSLFIYFKDDVPNSEALFPDIFQFYSIKEYHEPIVDFTAALLDSDLIKAKKLSSYKKMILTNAKLELKREKSRIATQAVESEEVYYDEDQAENLKSYMQLLYPFRADKNIKEFFATTKALDSKEINIETARLGIVNKNADKDDIEKLLQDQQTLFPVYNMLATNKDLNLIKNITDEQLAASGVVAMNNIDPEKETVTFIEKREAAFNNKTVSFYFFKVKDITKDAYRGKEDRLAAIAFINDEGKIDPFAYKTIKLKWITDNHNTESEIKAIIDATLNEDKIRAAFIKKTDYDMEEYEDYEDY